MMTFHPYNPPVELPQERCGRLTAHEVVLQKMTWSLGCAILSCVSMAAMVCLVDWHDPGKSMIIGDEFPFSEVVVPLGIATMAASLAFLFSVPVFLSGRIMPTVWLLPLVFVILCFMASYDWYGLLKNGKPRFEFWPRCLDFAWLFFRYRGGWQLILLGIGIAACFKFLHWDFSRNNVAATDQAIAAEIAAWSAQTKTSSTQSGTK